ncbi:hypothetical protein ACRRTK_013254 [Alexandromys fortis]
MEARGMRLALWLLTFYMLMQMLSSELFAPGVKRELCESGYLGGKTALCNHPVRRGFCGLHLYRYYFNKITLLCEPFVFSGCGGNRNNFKSKYLCEFYCINKQLTLLLNFLMDQNNSHSDLATAPDQLAKRLWRPSWWHYRNQDTGAGSSKS